MRSRVNERDWDRANMFVGGGGAKTPTLDPVCIRETPEKMIVWSLPPQMKNPRYGPGSAYFQPRTLRSNDLPSVLTPLKTRSTAAPSTSSENRLPL